MSVTTVGAGLDLADALLKALAPTITQEQKESLLDAYKDRTAKIQSVVNALAGAPADRSRDLALRDLTDELLNDDGLAATGLAALDIPVPLDTLASLLNAANLLALLLEQQAAATGGTTPTK